MTGAHGFGSIGRHRGQKKTTMANIAWQRAAFNAIGMALGRPPDRLSLNGISRDDLHRTKIDPFIQAAADPETTIAGGYFHDARRLQRAAFV